MRTWFHYSASALTLVICLPCNAATSDYRFTPFVPRAALAVPPNIGMPALVDNRTAAVGATLRRVGEAVITTRAPGPVRVIAREKTFSRFGNLAVNTAGQVAFEASLENVTPKAASAAMGRRLSRSWAPGRPAISTSSTADPL